MDFDDHAAREEISSRTAMGSLGVEFVSATAEQVVLQLEVGPKVHQPFGFLHGGVSALLSETGASFGAWLAAGEDSQVMGVEINANHLRPVREGIITSTSTPIRQGRTIAVWDTKIEDAEGRLVCVSRCTLAIRQL